MIGYHCTPTKNIESIKNNGFRINNRLDLPGDLGSGVYLFIFLDGYNNAKEMAIKFGKRYRSKGMREPLSLITVEFDENQFADMRDIDSKKIFNKVREENKQVIEERFSELKQNFKQYSGSIKRGNLDGYVFDMIKEKSSKLAGFIKDTYTPVDIQGYRLSSFPNAVECCVYNLDIINIKSITREV